MRLYYSILILPLLLYFSISTFGQTTETKLGFEKSEHDFGTIKEEDGKVSYEFKFTNKTNQPIKIENVKASCGCTTPSWTRSAIEPGMSGYVKAQYDPTNRPNSFTKSLAVSFSIGTSAGMETLIIKGLVIPRKKTTSDLYPIKNGNLRLTAEYLNFYNINTKSPVEKKFYFYNEGNKKINFTVPTNLPAHLKLSITPLVLNPKDSGQIQLTYDAKLKKDYGYVYDAIEIETNDTISPIKKLFVVAEISDYFPPTSREDSLKAPKISFDRSVHDFGKITQGDIVSTNFEITNTGKSELKIHKTKASCGCTVAEPEKTSLKPGEKTSLKVTFNSTGKVGQDNKSITIYSNDPSYSEGMVIIKSDIQVPQIKDTTTLPSIK